MENQSQEEKNQSIIRLRKYSTMNVFNLQNLLQKRISLVHPSQFNDPMDTIYQETLENHTNMADIRVACFTRNGTDKEFNDYLMWTHYGDQHRGIAFEYIFKKTLGDNTKDLSMFGEVKYIPKLFGEVKALSKLLIQESQDSDLDLEYFFYSKDKLFEYELEHRLLYRSVPDIYYMGISDPDDEDSDIRLSKIILGYRCSAQDQQSIKKINRGWHMKFKMPSSIFVTFSFELLHLDNST